MKLKNYLNFLNEQKFGVAPPTPVQKPQASRPTSPKRVQPKVPKNPTAPEPPQNRSSKIAYFNYMLWTSKILKQGEIFRRMCYTNNCDQYEIGTGDRRICKDRCDIESYKKVISLLRVSMSKCNSSEFPEKCRVRYMQLIPLYQEKLNKLSGKYIKAEKSKQRYNTKVG